jgi:hypothetical protein
MTVNEILAVISGIKPIFKAVSALVTVTVGRFAFKFQQDLPAPVLIILAIAEVYALSFIQDADDRAAVLKWAVAGLIVSSIIFLLVYRYLSFPKKVHNDPSWWQFWRKTYDDIRVVGGYWLRPEAKKVIKQNNITTADYFAGVAFEEDKVWSGVSRVLSWLTLVVSYFTLILCGVGVLFLISEGVIGRH